MAIPRIFEISKKSFQAIQSAINAASQNINSTNDDDSMREIPDMTVDESLTNQLAADVVSDKILNIKKQFIVNLLWKKIQHLGEYNNTYKILMQIDAIFADSTELSVQNVMLNFLNAWYDLGANPGSSQARSIVKEKGVMFLSTFRRMYEDFENLRNQLQTDIYDKVKITNQTLSLINNINQQISPKNYLDLRWKRNDLINNVSKYIDIEVKENNQGLVTISMDGFYLLSGNIVNELLIEKSMTKNFVLLQLKCGNSNHQQKITSGEIASLLTFHNKRIIEYLNGLTRLSYAIAKRVNIVHSLGHNSNGITGLNFFAYNSNNANTMGLNTAIAQDTNLIAACSSMDSDEGGDIANAISDIRFEKIIDEKNVFEFNRSIMSEIKNQLQKMKILSRYQQLIVEQLKKQIDRISGASLEEEKKNLIENEKIFYAATQAAISIEDLIAAAFKKV